jgi:hypothetical protein
MSNIEEGRSEYQRYCILIDYATRADWYRPDHPTWRVWGAFYKAFGADNGTWHCKGWEQGAPEINLVNTIVISLRYNHHTLDDLELLFKQFLELELKRLNGEI